MHSRASGNSVAHQMPYSARRMMELARQYEAPMHAAFVDFSKAFDLVNQKKKSDAARAWIKEAGRMNHLKHSVP